MCRLILPDVMFPGDMGKFPTNTDRNGMSSFLEPLTDSEQIRKFSVTYCQYSWLEETLVRFNASVRLVGFPSDSRPSP